MSEGAPRHVVLVGPMASGKTTVGQALADVLGLDLIDLDRRLVRAHGPISEIFSLHGEARFREWETDELRRALSGTPSVIATGGGVVLSEVNRALLADATVVHLDISAETAARRLAGDSSRPLLATADPVAEWEHIAKRREPLYKEVATLSVTANEDGSDKVARLVLDALPSSTKEKA